MSATILLLLLLAACAAAPGEGAAGGGAGAPGGAGGGAGCPDLSAEGRCLADVEGGGCTRPEICTIAPDPCGAGEACCTAPFECRPVAGALPGGFRCAVDDDCASGLCVSVGGTGVCLRACQPDAGALLDCPGGGRCALATLAGSVTVHNCVGQTEDGAIDPARTFCLSDRDCADGRRCRIVGAAGYLQGDAFAVCLPDVAEAPIGAPCVDGLTEPVERDLHGTSLSGGCPAGLLCYDLCEGFGDTCWCTPEEFAADGCRKELRCLPPCRNEADCPSPWVCSEPDDQRVISTDHPELVFGFCRLNPGDTPEVPCLDETDCCTGGLRRDGKPCCAGLTSFVQECRTEIWEETSCRLTFAGAPGKWHGRCGVTGPLAPLGAACSADEQCDSALCAPDGAGGNFCSSVCERVLDRCEAFLPGTACGGVQVAAPTGEQVCVQACVPAGASTCE